MERESVRHPFVTIASAFVTTAAIFASAAPAAAQEAMAPTVESGAGVVAADHPQASQIGANLMAEGGNAVDAVVGTLLALGVLNPFASGLGGGGFCVVKPIDQDAKVLDFRERAPAAASRDMYIRDGKADIGLTMQGGLAVGVPGEIRGLEALHQKYGKLPWKRVVAPARKLAANGYTVGELLPKRLERSSEKLAKSPALAAAYQRDGKWVAAGEKLKQPGLGELLRRIEMNGAKAFHTGDVAAAIAKAVSDSGGIMTPADLEAYQVTWREPLKGSYRGLEVLTMPPPSSGGTTILETLNILERYDLATFGYNPESIHRITEALKHAFANRAQWLGDADFVQVPLEQIISKSAAEHRVVRPDGVLPLDGYGLGSAAAPPDDDGTSHVSVIDGDNNMVACTSTINTSFGSMVYVPEFGLVLNNEMGDFTAQPGVPNNYGLMGTEQNAVEPGKRPLSSMSPTLVLKDGSPYMAVGGSGGPTIITGTLLAIVRVVDWNWSADKAIAAPRLHHQWMPEKLFMEDLPESWEEVLKSRGHNVDRRRAYNSIQMVLRREDGNLVGVSDPRKMGRPAAVVEPEEAEK